MSDSSSRKPSTPLGPQGWVQHLVSLGDNSGIPKPIKDPVLFDLGHDMVSCRLHDPRGKPQIENDAFIGYMSEYRPAKSIGPDFQMFDGRHSTLFLHLNAERAGWPNLAGVSNTPPTRSIINTQDEDFEHIINLLDRMEMPRGSYNMKILDRDKPSRHDHPLDLFISITVPEDRTRQLINLRKEIEAFKSPTAPPTRNI